MCCMFVYLSILRAANKHENKIALLFPTSCNTAKEILNLWILLICTTAYLEKLFQPISNIVDFKNLIFSYKEIS